MEVLAGSDSRMMTVLIRDTYGLLDSRKNLVTELMAAATTRRPLSLTEGDQRVDIAEVNRVARAVALLATSSPAESAYARWEIGTESPPTVKEVVELFQEAGGFEIVTLWGARRYRGVELFDMAPVYPWLDGWEPDAWRNEFIEFVSQSLNPAIDR